MSLATDRDAEAWSDGLNVRPSLQTRRVREAELERARHGSIVGTRAIVTAVSFDIPRPTASVAVESGQTTDATDATDATDHDSTLAELSRFAELAYRERTGEEDREYRILESILARLGALRVPA